MLSPFTNPEYVTVSGGRFVPYTFDLLSAVTVSVALLTVKLWSTGGAANQLPLPACEARSVHVPTPVGLMFTPLAPDVMHAVGVSDEKLTGSPDVAVAKAVKFSP